MQIFWQNGEEKQTKETEKVNKITAIYDMKHKYWC